MNKKILIILGIVVAFLLIGVIIFFTVNKVNNNLDNNLDNNYYEQMTDNEKVKIELKGNASTGYKWEPIIQDTNVTKLVYNNYTLGESNGENENVIGTFSFLFDSIEVGSTNIVFNYTNGVDIMYTLTYTIEIDSEMKVTVQEGEGTYPEINIPMPEIEVSNG